MGCFICVQTLFFSMSVRESALNEKLIMNFSKILLILGRFCVLDIAVETSLRFHHRRRTFCLVKNKNSFDLQISSQIDQRMKKLQ